MESYHAKEKLRVGATSTAMLISACGVSNGTELSGIVMIDRSSVEKIRVSTDRETPPFFLWLSECLYVAQPRFAHFHNTR